MSFTIIVFFIFSVEHVSSHVFKQQL